MLSVEKGAFLGKTATTQKLDASTGKEDPRVLVDHKLNNEHISTRVYFLSNKALYWKIPKSSISRALVPEFWQKSRHWLFLNSAVPHLLLLLLLFIFINYHLV